MLPKCNILFAAALFETERGAIHAPLVPAAMAMKFRSASHRRTEPGERGYLVESVSDGFVAVPLSPVALSPVPVSVATFFDRFAFASIVSLAT